MKKIALFGITLLLLVILSGFFACQTDANIILLDIEMVPISGGTFFMGGPEAEANNDIYRESPQHWVKLTGFQMSKYLITQAQYRAVMGKNPSFFQYKSLGNTDNFPVEQVSWYDAVEFCNRLSELEGRTMAYNIFKDTRDSYNLSNEDGVKWTVKLRPGTNGYRLPTEAQWEYACRAGTTTPFNTGATINTDQANFNAVPYIDGDLPMVWLKRPTEVGSYLPNAWGLYDMHGNVYEWCWDWTFRSDKDDFYKNYYDIAPNMVENPTGLDSGNRRITRGGSWDHPAVRLRSAWRERSGQWRKDYYDLGFRVVLPVNSW